MVAIATLIVATGEGAERISSVGSGLGEHKVLAEHVGGNESVGVCAWKYKASGYDHIVEHLPRVAVCVRADAVVEHFPHRIV